MKYNFIILSLFWSLQLLAQTIISSDIVEDTRWSGRIHITGDILVHKNATLTIEPGTRILLKANSDTRRSGKDPQRIELTVTGRLIAQGKPNAGIIVFTSDASEPRMNDWYGIIIKNFKNHSSFRHCIVEYGYKGITCYGSSPRIEESEIRYNQYAGISSEVRAKPSIQNTTIIGNDFAGLICELASEPLVERSIITQNANGVIVFDQSRPDLGRIARGNQGSSGENLIFYNFDTNIYNHSSNDVYAQNNLWNIESEAKIRATFFDKHANPGKGEVIFLPVFGKKAGAEPAVIAAAPVESNQAPALLPASSPDPGSGTNGAPTNERQKPQAASGSPANTTTVAAVQAAPQQAEPRAADQPASQTTPGSATTAAAVQAVSQPPELRTVDKQPSESTPASTITQYLASNRTVTANSLLSRPEQDTAVNADSAAREAQKKSPEPAPKEAISQFRQEPQIQQPLVEALLDGGRREYVRRPVPQYPLIYQQTKYEGKVLVEVIVGKDGRVQEHRVLMSDGKYFTQAAVEAIKDFRYKTGTYKGRPVQFRVVEPFVFKMN